MSDPALSSAMPRATPERVDRPQQEGTHTMTETDSAVAALRQAIADIDRQLGAGADRSTIDEQIAALQAKLTELRNAKKANPKTKELRRRRAELAKAIALITGVKDVPAAPKRTMTTGGGSCPVCGLSYPSAQALSMHRRRAHEGMGTRKPSDAPPARDPDRAVDTLRDHRQPLAEHVELDEARELIEARVS